MMSSALRHCLLALVILTLVFVHITQAVSLVWIVPLYLAAAAAPFSWRLQQSLSYQVIWNIGLLAVFALLLQHLVYRGGVRHLLEDGLRLAAFCQVHILNNLVRHRKPDLIFFNSFLIAIVTSLFCQDLIYSLVFVVFAMVLILGLQLAATEVNGVRLAGSTAFEVRSSARHAAIGLTLTTLVFVFCPRNFEREGLVEERLLSSERISEIGFSEQIRLGRQGRVIATDTVVLRARLQRGDKEAVPLHWRGITYLLPLPGGWGGENRWQSDRHFSLDRKWLRDRDGLWHREGRGTAAVLTVDVLDRITTRLFAPLAAQRVDIRGIAYPKIDGNFKLIARSRRPQNPLTYRVEIGRKVVESNIWSHVPQKRLAEYLRLPDKMVPASLDRLYQSLRRDLPPAADPREVADLFARHLAQNHDYLLPGEDGAAQNLDEFVRGSGGGHCEYFASTMVILLRKHSIPCRLVGGYLAHEWDADEPVLIIRKRHAHAWVEAWDKDSGWFTVDATPARSGLAGETTSAWSGISSLWEKVRSFNANARDAVLTMLGDKISVLWRWCWQHPFLLALLAALAVILFRCYRRWRAPFTEPAVASYVAALRRVGLELQHAETPRQLLARARTMDLPPAKLEILACATAEHERERYSSASTDAR